ncbi:hypothetical protein MD535_15315 [Vibrio sp. ZSDZ65]|uniref:Lipoprotein n=1 Tax=Vibrio qingdaonensis TaxID=2829491 RepID=A0A9X3CPJ1_9VIBR|nr:hypothetical protein [Vibrio qingdaonensis]MCW8347372.1 hypothetical protein [Vibrio qingdaonensis]
MHFRTIFILAVTAIIMTGCATAPQLSRSEWHQVTTRHYDGVTKNQALDAARSVLEKSDHDFEFTYPDDQLSASREWWRYVILSTQNGADNWIVKAYEANGGVDVKVSIGRQEGATMPAITSEGDFVSIESIALGKPVTNPKVYEFFFKRLDSELDHTIPWLSCDDFDIANKDAGYLCGVTSD